MMKKKACCSGRKIFHFSNPLEIRYVDGKHSGSWQSTDRELPNNLILALGQAVWIGTGSLWLEEARSRLLCSRPMMMMMILALGVCDEDAFPNISRLLGIACTLPITSAEAEPSFSLIKSIKTCSRSTMPEDGFSDLAVDRHKLLREIRGRQDMLASLCKGLSKKALSLFDKQLSLLHCTLSP